MSAHHSSRSYLGRLLRLWGTRTATEHNRDAKTKTKVSELGNPPPMYCTYIIHTRRTRDLRSLCGSFGPRISARFFYDREGRSLQLQGVYDQRHLFRRPTWTPACSSTRSSPKETWANTLYCSLKLKNRRKRQPGAGGSLSRGALILHGEWIHLFCA